MWRIALPFIPWLLQPIANAQPDAETLEAVQACRHVAGLSSRLACYDRVFPPLVESTDGDDSSPSEERSTTAATPEPAPAATARIVEVQTPSLGTTLFRAEDGRVFVRENARTIPRWPDTPFEVEIDSGILGTSTFLVLLDSGLRIRVVVRD